jgi:hypothetical protein
MQKFNRLAETDLKTHPVANKKKLDRVRYTLYICLRITGVLDFVHHPEFQKLENAMFRTLDLFPSSGEGRHLLCWIPAQFPVPSLGLILLGGAYIAFAI